MATEADQAAARVTRFLDERGPERDDVIATAGPRAVRYAKPRLRVDDLRTLLADREQLQRCLDAAEAATCKHDEAGD